VVVAAFLFLCEVETEKEKEREKIAVSEECKPTLNPAPEIPPSPAKTTLTLTIYSNLFP